MVHGTRNDVVIACRQGGGDDTIIDYRVVFSEVAYFRSRSFSLIRITSEMLAPLVRCVIKVVSEWG